MRNPFSCLYTSSYDRGLEHLLKIWPQVKQAVPKAELHIFYGWELFERFYKDNPGSMAWKKRMEEMMTTPGITEHGRIPQPELKHWYETCGLWTYPAHFGEISCISAMKAQAWGAVPVVVDYAALNTTVKYGVKVEGDIYDKEVRERYQTELIDLLNDHDRQEEIRVPMMKWAQKELSWESVAKNWTKEFHEKKV